MSVRGFAWLLALGLCLSLVSAQVHAQEPDARAYFERGLSASRAGDFAAAVEAFEHARALSERPSVLRNLAVSLAHLGRNVEAVGALERALELTQVARERRDLETLRAELLTKVAVLSVEVAPADSSVELDGKVVSGSSLRCDTGEHTLSVQHAGFARDTRTLTLTAGARVERVSLRALELPEVAAPPPLALSKPLPHADNGRRSLKPWAIASLSLSLALAGGATALWLMADHDYDKWQKRCPPEAECSRTELAPVQAREDRLDRSSFALFGLSGAAALTAATLFWLHPRERARSRGQVAISPTRVHLTLRF